MNPLSQVLANVGVPMLFVTLPVMLLALLPIIAIETYVLGKKLNLLVGKSLGTAVVANLVSTLVGIPVCWLILVGVQFGTGGTSAFGIETPLQKLLAVTWQAPWLIPYESELDWMVPAAGLALLVPFFFASWLIEYFVARRMLREVDRKRVNEGVFLANLSSYGLLAVLVFSALIMALTFPSR